MTSLSARREFRPALSMLLLCILAACTQPAPHPRPAVFATGDAALDATRPTVLLTESGRDGRNSRSYIHVLDGQDLSSIARIRTTYPATEIRPVPGGRQLLVAQGDPPEAAGCCSLYLFDLVANTTCRLYGPVADFAASVDGQIAFSQQGDTPISVFDLQSALSTGEIDAGVYTYALSPSPDGRWLAARSRFTLDGQQVVKFIDTATRQAMGSVPLDAQAGAWLGEVFQALVLAESFAIAVI